MQYTVVVYVLKLYIAHNCFVLNKKGMIYTQHIYLSMCIHDWMGMRSQKGKDREKKVEDNV